jgi:hypothetical protein
MKRKGKKPSIISTPGGANPPAQPPAPPASNDEDRLTIAEMAIRNLTYNLANAQAVEAERFQKSLRVKPSRFARTKPKG